jgi:hypothetical protein
MSENWREIHPVNVHYLAYLRTEKGKKSLRPKKSKNKSASHGELGIYIVGLLSRASFEDFTCYPSLSTIGRDCGCSQKTAWNVLQSLIDMGWVKVVKNNSKNKKINSKTYKLMHFKRWYDSLEL